MVSLAPGCLDYARDFDARAQFLACPEQLSGVKLSNGPRKRPQLRAARTVGHSAVAFYKNSHSTDIFVTNAGKGVARISSPIVRGCDLSDRLDPRARGEFWLLTAGQSGLASGAFGSIGPTDVGFRFMRPEVVVFILGGLCPSRSAQGDTDDSSAPLIR